MNTQLNRMLFSRAFVKVSACVVLSAGCLPMTTYAESIEAPVVENVLQQKAISGLVRWSIRKENPLLVRILWKKALRMVQLQILMETLV